MGKHREHGEVVGVIFLENVDGVHIQAPGIASEYTLCGDAIEGDCLREWPNFGPAEVVRAQVITCERCREFIELCHAINGAWLRVRS